jgi:processive 1,2-diacylglycerol beta-glucosyltransferase
MSYGKRGKRVEISDALISEKEGVAIMKKALFLPFLTMQTGHHQVADALMAFVEQHIENVEVKKIDLLHYANPTIEKIISQSYLKWISYAPGIFNHVYSKIYDQPVDVQPNFKVYELLLKYLQELLKEEKPDVIFCTHSVPSYLLNVLKKRKECDIPVVNVYTDFFVSKLWGKELIDYHFLPMEEMKETLSCYNIDKSRMLVTGIPLHEELMRTSSLFNKGQNVLIAGGNCGIIDNHFLSGQLKREKKFHFYVLCGNNEKLYSKILHWRLPNVTPLHYISSRSEMNALYDQMDAIVTKPGGVTVSEALRKKLPIFVHSILPGQEERNFTYLMNRGLAFSLKQQGSLQEQLEQILLNEQAMQRYNQAVNLYHEELAIKTADDFIEVMNNILYGKLMQAFTAV